MTTPPTTPRWAQTNTEADLRLNAHLAECVECWEAIAAYEEQFGIDIGLPEHPEMTSEEARRAHG